MHRRVSWIVASLLALFIIAPITLGQDDEQTTDNTQAALPEIKPSAPLQRLIDDKLTTDKQRAALKAFHGQWDKLDDLSIEHRAVAALYLGAFDHAVFRNEQAPSLLRAEAALHRGEAQAAIELVGEDKGSQATWIKGQAYERMGEFKKAMITLAPLRQPLADRSALVKLSAADIMYAANAGILIAQMQGGEAREFRNANDALNAAYDRDRLYWPAMLVHARLLYDKDNGPQAVDAIKEVLSLNPKCAEAYYMLGRMAARGFAFEGASACATKLRLLAGHSLYADLLEVHSYLVQRDPASARKVLDEASKRFPKHHELAALRFAAESLAYDKVAAKRALARFEELSPGHPLAHLLAGTYLSLARQYTQSRAMLDEAIRRRPGSARAHLELGLMLMQYGDEKAAHKVLLKAYDLDPFNVRVFNQLELVEQLQKYKTIETKHFVIKYRDAIDEVLARDMEVELETIYAKVTGAFEHKPTRKTIIEILPGEEPFAVRITGLPEIWTVAACTGDVIAMVAPRAGGGMAGTYDWYNVVAHEYTHTVTLSQTSNRIAHWLTEAAAQTQEIGGRDERTVHLLARAFHDDDLFTLDNITWGFVRPRSPMHRPLAYAQSHLMFDYIVETHGRAKMLNLLELQGRGIDESIALEKALGVSADAFSKAFHSWMAEQMKAWGMTAPPEDAKLRALLQKGESASLDEVDAVLNAHPQQPDLLKLRAMLLLRAGQPQKARQALLAYSQARPFDTWPHRQLVDLATQQGRIVEAMDSLVFLDRYTGSTGRYASRLAMIHQLKGDMDSARQAIRRALHREAYNARYREFAAAIELQANDARAALRHVRALTILEPTVSLHFVRLAALQSKLGDAEAAREAAIRARQLDPDAAVDAFLKAGQ